MKRSEINHAIDHAIGVMKKAGYPMPPFAYYSVDDWKNLGDDEEELENFKKRKYQYMAKDKDGRDVFLADSGYVLSMAQEDFKNIKFHFTSEF